MPLVYRIEHPTTRLGPWAMAMLEIGRSKAAQKGHPWSATLGMILHVFGGTPDTPWTKLIYSAGFYEPDIIPLEKPSPIVHGCRTREDLRAWCRCPCVDTERANLIDPHAEHSFVMPWLRDHGYGRALYTLFDKDVVDWNDPNPPEGAGRARRSPRWRNSRQVVFNRSKAHHVINLEVRL